MKLLIEADKVVR